MPLTPEEIAEAEAIESSQSQPFNPIRDLSEEDLADLAVQDHTFKIADEFAAQKELWGDQALVQKVADAQFRLKNRGTLQKIKEDLPSVGEAGEAVLTAGKGLAGQIWNYASTAGNLVAGAASELVGAEGMAQAYKQDIDRRLAENISGTEEALTGVSQLGEKIIKKAGRATGISKSLDEWTPEDRVKDLFDEVGKVEVRQERLKGGGAFTQAVTGGVAGELDPEKVGTLAAGDPVSLALFSKGLGGATKAAAKIPGVRQAAGAVNRLAERAIPAVAGGVVTGGATAADKALGVLQTASPAVFATTGGAIGASKFGWPGAIAGIGAGGVTGRTIARGARSLRKPVQGIAEFGRQVSGSAGMKSAYAMGARDALQALPGAAGEVVKGTALDLGLAAVSAELPEDVAGAVGFGTVAGALSGAAGVGRRVLSGQLIGPREYGVAQEVPSSGTFPSLDAMHAEGYAALTPGQQARINAAREFQQSTVPNGDLFVSPSPEAAVSALLDIGVPRDTAELWSQQAGVFTGSFADAAGNQRFITLVRDPAAAPHESFHPIQDVLGEPSNQAIDRVVRDAYADTWETEGRDYAQRLVGDMGDRPWQEIVLEATGKGAAEAYEKLYREISNRMEGEIGARPDSTAVNREINAERVRLVEEARQRNPQLDPAVVEDGIWRDILTPEEMGQAADSIIARELAAENFDAIFKSQGPRLEEGKQLPQQLARVVGSLMTAFGADPLAGRVSELGGSPLRAPAVAAVRDVAKGLQARETPIAPRRFSRPASGLEPPRNPAEVAASAADAQRRADEAFRAQNTPEAQAAAAQRRAEADAATQRRAENADAQAAQDLADAAPSTPAVAGQRSPRQMLGDVAEAIRTKSGVRINYLSAPDEPAAATSSNRAARRAIIEEFRTIPKAARSLWEKSFFPSRVRRTSKGEYQIEGWAPEVFAANAHKLANFLSELPDGQPLSPYALDPTAKTFTPEGWQELYVDVQAFVQNQLSGATGSGLPLVVPRSVTDAGGYAPAKRSGAVPLDQARADFINLLFGLKLPETPRMTKGKRPLNIIGQEVSAATLPGRVEPPVRPRGRFTGEEATAQGIEGTPIQEVNPLRNQIEAAAAAAKKAPPSFIEAIQKLNLENIAEVQMTPEAPPFGGNTLTLTAGFSPRTAAGRQVEKAGFEIRHSGDMANPAVVLLQDGAPAGEITAIRNSPVEADISYIKIEPRFRGQRLSEVLYREIGQRLKEEGVEDVTGMIVSPKALAGRKRVFPDTAIEGDVEAPNTARSYEVRSRISPQSRFSPAKIADQVENFSPAEFREWSQAQDGGFTFEAYRVGQASPSREFADSLKSRYESLALKARAAMKSGDFDDASAIVSQAQFFQEAYGAATGTGSAGKFLRQQDEGWVAPFPPE